MAMDTLFAPVTRNSLRSRTKAHPLVLQLIGGTLVLPPCSCVSDAEAHARAVDEARASGNKPPPRPAQDLNTNPHRGRPCGLLLDLMLVVMADPTPRAEDRDTQP